VSNFAPFFPPLACTQCKFEFEKLVLHQAEPELNFTGRGPNPTMKFRVVLQQDDDGAFVVEVPSIPGCVSQGVSRAQALDNIREAIEGYLESLKQDGEPILPPIDEEVVDVAI
jgi:predicted RNase H-like HicB family nuclease